MQTFVFETKDPSELERAVTAAMAVSGNPGYPAVRPIGKNPDHAYLAMDRSQRQRGDAWTSLEPDSSAGDVARAIISAVPDIAAFGFRLQLVDPDLAPGSDPMFRIERYGL